MTTETLLKQANELIAPYATAMKTPELERLDVIVDGSKLVAAVQALVQAEWGYLAGITGLDAGADAGSMEVLYHFCAGAAIVTLRVTVARAAASVPTLGDIIPSVSFYERELHEMFGIEVAGLANTAHLFLPDDWEQGVYPLRKNAEIK